MNAVNPEVVHAKYDRELAQLVGEAARFRRKGILLLEAAFPTVLVGFAAPQLKPAALVMGVRFDYSDFDVKPPSVRFVDPFTGVPYAPEEMPTQMLRSVEMPLPEGFPAPGVLPAVSPSEGVELGQADAAVPRPMMVSHQPLVQVHEGGVPFLCLAGVREFHEHPGHTGQPWELERPSGAGSLVRLVEVIHKYAVESIGGWAVNLVPQVSLGVGEPPR